MSEVVVSEEKVKDLTEKVQEHRKRIERLTFTVGEAAQVLGIGTSKMSQLTKSKDFPVIRVGRRILIPIHKFEEWIDNNVGKEF